MSYWTQITGSIYADTYIADKNIEQIVKDIMDKAPKITGSEGPADIFVNVMPGHSMSLGFDCEPCPHNKDGKMKEGWNGDRKCGLTYSPECKFLELQSFVSITIAGSLRDRWIEDTQQEYKEFIKYIKKQGWDIRAKSHRINGTRRKDCHGQE